MALYRQVKERLRKTTQAFLYKWTHIPTQKWYVGSRTTVGCHINDGYICSSKDLMPLIKQNTTEWKREILVIGKPKYIRELENKYLMSLDAKNDFMSFNMHNGDGKFTTTGRTEPEHQKKKRIAKLKGQKKPEGFGEMIRKARTGMKFDTEWRKNIGKSSLGRKQSTEAKEKNRKNHLGENNHFYGKQHSKESKIKCGLNNKGTNSASWKGYWISPSGEKFTTIKEAHNKFPIVAENNLRIWCKTNKNGWSFEPSEKVK